MPINNALLVTSPMLQDPIVDVTGIPAANGIITCYQDNSRTTLKNWYYQSGAPGNYTYVTLPNPMVLSASGTIIDVNGNDTIPFFYPYSELDNITSQPYYITCVNSSGQGIFSRQNFPYSATTSLAPSGTATSTLANYIVNNTFWRNISEGSATTTNISTPILNPQTGFYQTVVCPSQHDGYTVPDISFAKNGVTSTETVLFQKFPFGSIPFNAGGDITPEYYLTHVTSVGGGETIKGYLFPISLHIKTLESVVASITFWATNNNGISNSITPYIYQFAGSGVTSNPPTQIGNAIALTNNWAKYIVSFTLPSASGVAVGVGGDDALYLLLGMPVGLPANLSFALPSIYLSTTLPTNNFTTYDQSAAIINSPRTGDIRTSVNTFGSPNNFGWVPMNDGVIALNNPNALTNYSRANYDTWPLYNMLWQFAKTYDTGSTINPICQLYNNSGTPVNYAASTSGYSDFSAGNALALTKAFGRVLTGTVPLSQLLPAYISIVTFGNSGVGSYLTATMATPIGSIWPGMPISFTTTGTLPTGIVANNIYYITNISGATFEIATSFINALNPLTSAPIAYTNAGTATTTMYVNTMGAAIGEASHTLLASELASHVHSSSGGSFVLTGAGLNGVGTSAGFSTSIATGTNITLPTVTHNNTSLTTFYNVYIKL